MKPKLLYSFELVGNHETLEIYRQDGDTRHIDARLYGVQACIVVEAIRQREEQTRNLAETVLSNDKTTAYTYSGKRSLNAMGEKPGMGKRWLTPAEVARAYQLELGAADEMSEPITKGG